MEALNLFQSMPKISDAIPRTRVSHIPYEAATNALFAPRISGKARRLFMNARTRIVELPRTERTDPAEKAQRHMKMQSLRQLGRRLTQATNQLRRFERLLEKTNLERFQKPLQERISWLRYCMGWLRQEVESRNHSKT